MVKGEETRGKSEQNRREGLPRRKFLKDVGQSALGIVAASELANTPVMATTPLSDPVKVPGHLPTRLTISAWLWHWLVACTPGEPYDDLDRVFAEHVERKFNTTRADVALNWCFDQQGRPRGPIDVAPLARDAITVGNRPARTELAASRSVASA